jgi:large subunit ribosomal protein L20
MSRVKRGTVVKKRHKRVLKQTKGYWGQRGNIFRRATETLLRALAFAYKGRKLRKRDFRSLFIQRIKAAAEMRSMKYSTLMHGLKVAHVELNRKVLSQMAIFDGNAFDKISTLAQSAIV